MNTLPSVPTVSWRQLTTKEVVIHILTKPGRDNKQIFYVHWRTDYIMGQPSSSKKHLVRGQIFHAILKWHVDKMKAKKRKVTIIDISY